ncbi:3-hydroxyacyl-CoA dehydrogenase NAD-binding domain-containing protein [Streptomyces sp. 21So2-11]|uniref:3-hydroxyacyl-CoA dehydrogenase NAD-binding domain-containing protein n=1 Tax=Streptomyces sp. 21So2-11 TaxID=3144408 RepID=UPI00321C2CC9
MTTDLRPVTGIVGLGTVGEAFLRLAHQAGRRIVAVDTDPDALVRVGNRRKALTTDAAESVVFTHEVTELTDAGLVIEAVPDDLAVSRPAPEARWSRYPPR